MRAYSHGFGKESRRIDRAGVMAAALGTRLSDLALDMMASVNSVLVLAMPVPSAHAPPLDVVYDSFALNLGVSLQVPESLFLFLSGYTTSIIT